MKRNLLPLMFFAAFVLLAVAIAVDCVRLAADARDRVQMADDEMNKHEVRLTKLLASSPQLSPEVKSAIATHEAATDIPARHSAYDEVVTSFQKTMSQSLDATNPLNRKFMDDTAGAINRRQVAEKPFDDEQAAYRAYLDSWRGQIARWFSTPAARDHQANTKIVTN